MPSFLANPGSMLVHTSDCDYAQLSMEVEEFHDLAHAYHCGYSEAGCCLGDTPTAAFERSNSVKRQIRQQLDTCVICDRKGRVEMAHIVPRWQGGVRRVPLCPNHHQAFDFGELTTGELRKLARHCNDHLRIPQSVVVECHGAGRISA